MGRWLVERKSALAVTVSLLLAAATLGGCATPPLGGDQSAVTADRAVLRADEVAVMRVEPRIVFCDLAAGCPTPPATGSPTPSQLTRARHRLVVAQLGLRAADQRLSTDGHGSD